MKPSKKARKSLRKKRPNPAYGAKLPNPTIAEMMTNSLIRQWFGSFGVLMSAGSPELKKAMLQTIGRVSPADREILLDGLDGPISMLEAVMEFREGIEKLSQDPDSESKPN